MHAKYAPKTNISKAYFNHVVEEIEKDPLIKPSTFAVACMLAAICTLLGILVWFAKINPGNLIRTTGTITNLSSGQTDTIGTVRTFVTYDFQTKDGQSLSVRSSAIDGLSYQTGQQITIGYHPKNPAFSRLLNDIRPPTPSVMLWLVPIAIIIWLAFVTLFRHHARQVEIWNAAEAANIED